MESHTWLHDRLGADKSVVGRVFRNKPILLTLHADTLETKANWIQNRLALTDEECSKMVSSYPNILTYSIEDGAMNERLSYLVRSFQLSDEELKHLVLKRPELVALSAKDNIEPKLEFYGHLIGKERAKKLVVERPYLLLASMKDVDEKY
mmetsp:Transcript_33724/g.99370  ORF Transcript_33724/g.99370 Transcript_33724/m.99370 type:complete len:150 (+) Transcript_33724:650-1099(+)